MKRLIVLLLVLLGIFNVGGIASAEDYKSDYEAVSFDTASGLKSLEINAIAQTADGYIWAGSYAGLYRYDGVSFTEVNLNSEIGSIMALYTDSQGNLWIGTNDSGIVCYDPETSKLTKFSTDNGLSSSAIRSIAEDAEGNIYVGTVGFLSVITPESRVITYSNLEDITCVRTLSCFENDMIAGVTNSGIVFFMKGDELAASASLEVGSGVYYASCCAMPDGCLLVGDSAGAVYQCNLQESDKEIEVLKICEDIGIGNIAYIAFDTSSGGYLICGDNGCGYLSATGAFSDLSTESFHGSVCYALCDAQKNIWFVSNKQGIMKLSKSPFVDIFAKAGVENHTVNAVIAYNGDLYVGCDDGLIVLEKDTYQQKYYNHLNFLKGVRIRHFYEDSENNLWISTYGADGLVCLDSKQNVTCYNEGNAGTMGGRFRSVIELQDHTILAASSTGLTYIKDGKVTATIGERDGLVMPQILTMVEAEDGSIFAGSDGDGIYVIQDQKIVKRIGEKAGLDSLVILRIVKCEEGYIYITSNSIYFEQDGKISKLSQFPYSNNYDIFISPQNEAWISSSAGLYVADKKAFLENKAYNYTLLNQNRGFDTTLTANAWNYVDALGDFYLCCSTGVKKVSYTDYNQFEHDYNLMINQMIVDNTTQVIPEQGKYVIPAKANRIVIKPAVLSFTLENPMVHMYLEGFDETGVTVSQKDLTEINYTNLPYGEYKFHIQILNERTREMEKEVTIPIVKEAQFFEYTFFKAYLILVICFVAIFITWLLSKYGSLTIIKRQYEEIRLAKEEAVQANQAKSQFLANMSHEIRTPINTIMGMNELVLREDIAPDVRRHSKDIQNASVSLLSLINDILDFSKIESGKMNIIPQEYDTEELLMGLSTMLHVKAEEKGLDVDILVDEKMPAKLLGDDTRIRQVILNLLSNAVKYTERGKVTFTVRLEQVSDNRAQIFVSVKDTGIGIQTVDMEKLFMTFERLDEKRNAHIQGSGLGLNITKELLALMGSELKVKSTYGKGSEFYFVLEQKILEEQGIGNIETHHQECSTDEDTYVPQFTAPEAQILVIDDNEMNLRVVQGLLAATKVQIETGTSGVECLEKIRQKHYDLIFLDHMMPQMDGVETFEHIQSEEHLCQGTPVIILTANAILGARETYLEKGFTDYLSKPVAGDALETVLAMYLPREKVLTAGRQAKEEPFGDADLSGSVEGHRTEVQDAITDLQELIVESDGILYCGGMRELYEEMLAMFVKQSEEKKQEISSNFTQKDWKNYAILVHALKSTSRNIGANGLADRAAELETAAKNGNEEYVLKKHEDMMSLYEAVIESAKEK